MRVLIIATLLLVVRLRRRSTPRHSAPTVPLAPLPIPAAPAIMIAFELQR